VRAAKVVAEVEETPWEWSYFCTAPKSG